MSIVNAIADACFILDLCLSFFKSYENDRGEMVTDLGAIKTNYLKFWFWVDFPSCIPVDAFFPDLKVSSSCIPSFQHPPLH